MVAVSRYNKIDIPLYQRHFTAVLEDISEINNKALIVIVVAHKNYVKFQ